MVKLLKDIVEAHGGVSRWNQFSKIDAQIVSGGKLFELKGLPQDTSPRQITVWLHEQRALIHPFATADQPSDFLSGRIAIETLNRKLKAERNGNPKEIHEHLKSPQRDPLDGGYVNGYALWIYLTTPFFMLLPDIEVRETDPWQEGDETWSGLTVIFPSHMATHGAVQNFYFGKDNLIRRNDYQLDIAGDFYVAQYISDLKDIQGILVPSKRRDYKRGLDGKPIKDELMVKIDLSDMHFS